MELNVGGFVPYSTVNGPGKRAVIWVQGCPLRCTGCFNPEFQPFLSRSLIPVDVIADEISDIEGIEGVTFSGGEPFCQAAALAELGRELRNNGFNVVTFSGFPLRFLRDNKRRSWKSLLEVTDLLVAGPYDSHRSSPHPLLSSLNQELVFLSPEFEGRVESTPTTPLTEFVIRSGGAITITGFPGENMHSVLSEKGRD